MATTKTKQPSRTMYVVVVPFPWRGHWTTKGQELNLLACEAQALLIVSKIELKSNGSK